MHRIIRIKAYEAEHGPHFNDEHARKAVNKMENEDGTRGQHWSLEETTALANQYGIRLDEKINKYDWYVALNMVYSDYYRVVVSMTGSNNTKYFVELAKAWMHDKEPEKEDPKIKELQDQVEELKGLIKQASNMVPPQMKQMLPQNIQKAMNEAS